MLMETWVQMWRSLADAPDEQIVMDADDLRRLTPRTLGERIDPDVVGDLILRLKPDDDECIQVAQEFGTNDDGDMLVQVIAGFRFEKQPVIN